MHARHRSPGNGYRSNSMGMTTGSRISPEGSMRSHGFYNSEYRSFNRSFGRNHGHGQLKSFQPPQPPLPRRGDIFMEAGRLAAEYLVSQGLLPPSALSGKWQNGSSFKKQVGDIQDYRSQEGDGVQFPGESRISGHSRLGDANMDGGSGRRRYSDDYGTGGWRNNTKGKRRGGSFRGNNSDWGRDYGRSSSWSDRHRASPDYSNNSRHREEQPFVKEDALMLDKSSTDVSTKNDDAGDAKPKASENEVKESPQLPNADHPNETDGEVINECDDLSNLKEKTGEMKDSSDTTETVKVIVVEELPPQQCTTKNKSFDKDGIDLRTLCKFANVPTRMRSSLKSRATKVDQAFGGEENSSNTVPSRGSEIVGEEDTLASTSAYVSSIHNDESKTSVPENSKEPAVEPIDDTKRLSPVRDYEQHEQVSSQLPPDTGKLSPTCSVDQGICLNTSSFPEKTTMPENDKEASADLQNFETLSSLVEKRGEKRDFEDNDVKEGNKRSREWLSSIGNMDDFFHVSNSSKVENDTGEVNTTSNEPSIETADQKSSASTSQLSGLGDKPCTGYMQEKQFFPGSFKICDLNLMGTSDINENHEGEPVFMYPSIPEFKQEERAVDIDLSISNSSSSLGHSKQVADCREIEIIDLENDSGTEDKAFEPERKMETTYTGMEGFSNPPQNVADIPDGQENYGLMISELLANDYSNCGAVPDEISPLDNMVLHNGEGTLADDDSIYMSLGEIPLLGFMRNWEQAPPQEDGKPF